MLTFQQQLDYLALADEAAPPTFKIASMIAIHFQLQCLSAKRPLYTSIIRFLSDNSNVFATPNGRDALVKMANEMLSSKDEKMGSEMEWMKRDIVKDFWNVIVVVARESFAWNEGCVGVDFETLESLLLC